MSATTEQNRRERSRQRKRRLTISFVIALLLHLLFAGLGGGVFLAPVAEEEKEEKLLEIADFIPEEETPDSAVKDPVAYSEKSYASERNERRRGTYGAPPSFAPLPTPPSPDKEEQAAGSDSEDFDPLSVERELAGMISEAIRESLREIHSRPDNRRPGNDGDHRGTSDENDFSVQRPQDKYISYIQKFRSRVQNAWRPNRVFAPNITSRDIYTVLEVEVKNDGAVGSIKVSKSSGVRAFDIEAVRSVRDAAPYSPFPRSWGDQSTFTFSFGFRVFGGGPI